MRMRASRAATPTPAPMPALAPVERVDAWETGWGGEVLAGEVVLLIAVVATLLEEVEVLVALGLEVLLEEVKAEGASGGAVS